MFFEMKAKTKVGKFWGRHAVASNQQEAGEKLGRGEQGRSLCKQEVQQQSQGEWEGLEGTSPTPQITALTAGKTQLWHTDRQSQTQGGSRSRRGEIKQEKRKKKEEEKKKRKQAAVQDPLLLGPPGASPVGYPPDEVDPLSG